MKKVKILIKPCPNYKYNSNHNNKNSSPLKKINHYYNCSQKKDKIIKLLN